MTSSNRPTGSTYSQPPAPGTAPRYRQPLTVRGLIGPKTHPDRHGFRQGDHHLIINDATETASLFTFAGDRLWRVPALARGQGIDREWRQVRTDTPPGLYLGGRLYRDWTGPADPGPSRDRLAFGWFSLDLIDLEGQEGTIGRAGIMLHGGGSALGWPGAWSPRQPLLPTLGCVRMHNGDIRDRILPTLEGGRLFLSVYQEA